MSEEIEENVRAHEKYLAGLFEGELKTQTRIVKNLLNKNMTDLKIMEITNLNKEELEKIKKGLK